MTVPQESHYSVAGDPGRWALADTDWEPVRRRGDTLVFRYLYAEKFRDGSPLDKAWLEGIREDLHAVREAGLKVIPRFAYRRGTDPVRRGRPYGDSPPVDAVLRHVDQLAPVLAEQADVVLAIQQGSYGLWGECCYTDHFATGYDERHVSDRNWADRVRVLDRWVHHTRDAGLPVLVRYSAIRQRYAMSSPAADDLARVGLHDDAFDADADDLGTFSLNLRGPVRAARTESADLALRLPFGGEHASVGARATTRAQIDAVLAADRPTYLLRPQLPAAWAAHADLLSRRLGYRLVATGVRVSERPAAGSTVRVEIDIRNDGVAPPVGARDMVVELVRSGRTAAARADDIAMSAFTPGATTTAWVDVDVPSDFPPGTAELRLWLPDRSSRLASDARYAVRLANVGSWRATDGRNVLGSVAVANAPVG